MTPLETIHTVYAAFGRGDVPAILALLADDVDWEYPEGNDAVPWLRRRRGRAAIADFFTDLAASIEFEHFEPKEFLAGPDIVVVVLDVTLRARSTGRRVVEIDEVHIWRFDDAGRIASFKHGADTFRHHAACVPDR